MEYKRDLRSSRKTNECRKAQPILNCVNHCLPGQGQGQWQAIPIAEPCPAINQRQARGQWRAIAVSEPCSCIPLAAPVEPCHPCVYNLGPPICPQPDVNKMYSCRKVCCMVENIPCPTTSTPTPPSPKPEEPKPEMIMEFAQTDISYDPNMSMNDQSMQWPEDPKLREINIKEIEVETREIRHRTGEREFEVVHRIASTKIPEDGGEPVTEYQEVTERKSPEEMELLNAQLPNSTKTILKNESQAKSLSKQVSLHAYMMPDKSETTIEDEVLLQTNSNPEENEPSVKRRKFGKLEDEDDENVPLRFRAASVRKHRYITETEMEIPMEDDEQDEDEEEQMQKGQEKRRKSSSTSPRDGQNHLMPRTSSLASPTETERTRLRSSRASSTEDAQKYSKRRRSSPASPPNKSIRNRASSPSASRATMRRDSARVSSSKNKRDPDDVLQREVTSSPDRNYEITRKVQDIEMSSVGSGVPFHVMPQDDQLNTEETSRRIHNDDELTENYEQQEINKDNYRSASQINEDAVPDEGVAGAASALLIRRHYTKETESKLPGDLLTKKNIISESTSEHRVKRYSTEPEEPEEPKPELEPEPQPSPKPRKRRVPKKPAKSKYPSNDIVPRCVREPHCRYVGTVCAHPCYSCPPCTCSYATPCCPGYPCCEMPCCSRFGFGGQYIYSPLHRQ
ncbi:serine/arginine repetitive matrix protein 1 [Drosophila willistoni]|uniref:serine/arginine repetitive matrix protein 1 n=1 Tax=Drosophila willistoni TaxID=7260 RepID=UPI000C26C31B|nr:serine/arginine repetitive matrix protein 1 [Drosophila willistoni]